MSATITSTSTNGQFVKYGLLVLGIILIGAGAYLIITHLVGVIEGAAGLFMILIGLFLLDIMGRY